MVKGVAEMAGLFGYKNEINMLDTAKAETKLSNIEEESKLSDNDKVDLDLII